MASTAPRKNVVVVSIDDLVDVVRYRDAFGVSLQTPAIDALMARGVTFENAFTPSPICNSARTAVLTGRSPFATGVHHNNGPSIMDVSPAEEMMIGRAHGAGWFTAARGKLLHGHMTSAAVQDYLEPVLDAASWRRGHISSKQPFYRALGDAPVAEEELIDAITAAWVEEFLETAPSEPFFLSVGFSKPHTTWDVPRRFYELYDRAAIRPPEIAGVSYDDLPEYFQNLLGFGDSTQNRIERLGPEAWGDVVHGYLAAISYADAQLGRVLAAMDATGRWADTTLVLFSDHGYHLGDRDHWHKFTLWEEAAAVPLVIVDPDVGRPGTRVSAPVTTLDIWPTLSALTGLPGPEAADGLDLSGLMADPGGRLPRAGALTSVYGALSLRTDGFRYSLYPSGEEELFRVGRGQVHGRDISGDPALADELAFLRGRLETEVARLGVSLVDAGEAARGAAGDDVFILIADARAAGGRGDDVYLLSVEGRVVERAGGGVDQVVIGTDAPYTLPEHVENALVTNGSSGAILGNRGANEIVGNSLPNLLSGRGGDDLLNGLKRDDTLRGGDGNDTLRGGAGDDLLEGERGDDRLQGERGRDRMLGDDGDDLLLGGEGRDLLNGGAGRDSLDGGDGADRLAGGRGEDTLLGGNGDDRLTGGEGRDRLSGGAGDDTLLGAGGDDRLDGRGGDDVMTGGGGADVFRVGGGRDVVTDFTPGLDRLEFDGGPARFSELRLRETSAGLRVSFGDAGDSVLLEGLAARDVGPEDFGF